MAGKVFTKSRRIAKPSEMVDISEVVFIKQKDKYVSRGGDKLESAIKGLRLENSFHNKIVLDVGASTGGFSDCILQYGAQKVFAVDVGYGLLAWKVRSDPRVKVYEKTHIKDFRSSSGQIFDWILADVSFNGLARLASVFVELSAPGTKLLLMVKPQFELSRTEVPVGGVVVDASSRKKASEIVRDTFRKRGFRYIESCDAGKRGRSGNLETFLFLEFEG